ncbi:MAG: hypothetical protein OSJ66_09090 [Clostridia bacterium]|nr:hypothetical protein [Clostridia bacterium]
MKKKIGISIGILVIVLIVAGIITNYSDSARVTTGHEPKCCIKVVSNDGSKVTYWGLGYKVVRYVGVSPNEPYESNIGVKMGNWFMKYELPKADIIEIEYEGQTITITDIKDIGIIENILLNSKYNGEICNGINTHKIILNKDIYYIKESCKEIQKGDKQATISTEDLETINNIISQNKTNEINSIAESYTFTKTYNVVNVADSNDENYLYLTIRKFQDEEVKTVKVQRSLANTVEKENNYEFTFQYTNNIAEDNIESIFANTMLIAIKKTDKQGLEQVQDSIR